MKDTEKAWCECGLGTVQECAEMPSRYCGMTEEYDFTLPNMTMRDYFAIKALTVIASGFHRNGEGYVHATDYPSLADAAFTMADVMLAARKVQS